MLTLVFMIYGFWICMLCLYICAMLDRQEDALVANYERFLELNSLIEEHVIKSQAHLNELRNILKK